MKKIREWAGDMEISCHKVFDATPNLQQALEDLIEAGCNRVLTSGGCDTAMLGIDIITQLNKQANGRIIIMPGGSVRSSNLSQLLQSTGAKEYHSSAILNNDGNFFADELEVSNLVSLLIENANN